MPQQQKQHHQLINYLSFDLSDILLVGSFFLTILIAIIMI